MEREYKCFYCERTYSEPQDALKCQEKHEKIIRVSNVDGVNHYIRESLINPMEISDGRNTFGELYHERDELVIGLLCFMAEKEEFEVWYSDLYSDGSLRPGFFLTGVNLDPDLQITYVLPVRYQNTVARFAKKLPVAPSHRAHNSKDVFNRLREEVIEPTIKRLEEKRYGTDTGAGERT